MDDLIRRARRSRRWFRIWLWMVPTAILLVTLIAIVRSLVDLTNYPGLRMFSSFGRPIGIFAIVVGLGGMIYMWSDQHKYRLSLAVARFAERHGLSFVEKSETSDAERFGRIIHPLGSSHSGQNFCFGKIGGREVLTIELSTRSGYGTQASSMSNQVVLLPGAAPREVEVCVRPRDLADAINSLAPPVLFDRPLSVPITAEFKAKCVVSGKSAADAENATRLLTPEAAALCAANNECTFLAHDGDVLVFKAIGIGNPGGPPEALLQVAFGFSAELGRTAHS
jgi:hypothetical protein